ncbi:MAG: TRAP transporter small permease subunit [Alphaproteobacteria bacterium]|nr:TRAP transporter small permease subunit [Alphaproteobacteria bacterium]
MASAVARLDRSVRAAEALVAGTGVLAVTASVLWGVLTRYVSHQPASWTGEVAAIAFCWSCLVGASWIYGSGHPRIFEPAAVPGAALRRLLATGAALIEAFVLVAVLYLSLRQMSVNFDNPTPILRLPVSIYYLPLAWFAAAALSRLALAGRPWT